VDTFLSLALQRQAAMRELRERGWTLQQVADLYGVSRQRAHQIVRKVYHFSSLGSRGPVTGRPPAKG